MHEIVTHTMRTPKFSPTVARKNQSATSFTQYQEEKGGLTIILRPEHDRALGPRDIVERPRISIPEDAWKNVQGEQGDRDIGDYPNEEEEGDEAGSEEGYERFEGEAEGEHAEEVEHPENEEARITESARKEGRLVCRRQEGEGTNFLSKGSWNALLRSE